MFFVCLFVLGFAGGGNVAHSKLFAKNVASVILKLFMNLGQIH